MKKISCSLIALLATATVAFATTTPIDQLTFSTNSNNEIVITGGDFNITDLNIPSQINGLDVTTIGEYAFTDPSFGNQILISITLPASVTSIGNRVFSYCSNLASITFLGDAPTVGSTIFRGVASSAKVYVLPAATGFGTTFEGLPVETFTLPPSIHAIAHHNDNLLITLNEGTSGITVEETADLTADNWITNHNPTVTNGAFQLPTTHTHRYYRFSN
ncbi:MAG: hypothetical protein EVA58_03545 [Kiritimatiellaceae bacterium]|nr:MAG: hypothetical protein EVA58_03545 [Kiritimatiellaceae bacterium]